MNPALRFVSIALPDVAETFGRGANNAPPQRKKQRQPKPWSLKKENPMPTTNPTPDEIQAGLDAMLVKFLDAAPTPEKKAEVLIKIGGYQVELSKYAPMLRDADIETARETLAEWFDAGDGEMKKALVNAGSGSEEFPLMKMAIAEEGPEYDLAKMFHEAPSDSAKMVVLQNIGFYTNQVSEMLDRGELMKIAPDDIDEAVAAWVEDGDGSHMEMKKAIAADVYARRQAAAAVGENEAVDEKAGNGPSSVAAKLTGHSDREYVPRSTADGAGPRKRGTMPAPGQSDAPVVNPGSGVGEGDVHPIIIRRKSTTGGLGSVNGAQADGRSPGDGAVGNTIKSSDEDERKGKPKKKVSMKKSDLAGELVKFLPDEAIQILAKYAPEDQATICDMAAQDAADLMAWSDQQDPDRLQKAELDSAITEWLSSDPDPAVIQMKKHVAEALGTAEEIPIGLAQAIMSWQQTGTPALQVRRPSYAAT